MQLLDIPIILKKKKNPKSFWREQNTSRLGS